MAGLQLPEGYLPCTSENISRYAFDLVSFLSASLPASLLTSHPNTVALDTFCLPVEWMDWWDWAGRSDVPEECWQAIVRQAYNISDGSNAHGGSFKVPDSITAMLNQCRKLSLPRTCSWKVTEQQKILPVLMKEKKAHEVAQMSTFVGALAKKTRIEHVVDVGAGQGYVTRALAGPPHSLQLLAVEGSELQILGGKKRAAKRKTAQRPPDLDSTRVSFQALEVNDQNLEVAVNKWINVERSGICTANFPVPVLLMGLHACGALTPSIIRSFIRYSDKTKRDKWYAAALVIIGCCYHLMDNADFPVSKEITDSTQARNLTLQHDHYILAVQTPEQWLKTSKAFASAKMALRKISYRALLNCLTQRTQSSQVYRPHQRVYKVPDRYYGDFETYVLEAASRQIENEDIALQTAKSYLTQRSNHEQEARLLRRIEVLHTLRCILGPLVESLILLDRYLGATEALGLQSAISVQLINLFDQDAGSPRNMALVVQSQ